MVIAQPTTGHDVQTQNNKPGARGKGTRGSALSFLWASTSLLTILTVFAGDLVLRNWGPLKEMNHSNFASLRRYYVVSKLPKFLESARQPQIIFTGSSLLLNPAMRCFEQMQGLRPRYDVEYIQNELDTHDRCEYMEKLLRETGHQVETANLATAAGIFSDQLAILRKCINMGKKPQVLISDVSPRTFLDNFQPEFEKTPVYLVLLETSNPIELWRSQASLATQMNSWASQFFQFVHDRRDHRQVLSTALATWSHHPVSLTEVTPGQEQSRKLADNSSPSNEQTKDSQNKNGTKPNFDRPADKGRDLNYYKSAYLPINEKIYEAEVKNLHAYLELAKQNHLTVILVRMPLSKANQDLLPGNWKSRFTSELETAAQKYGANLIEPAKIVDFNTADFDDSAHLNSSGGAKLFKVLTRKINDLKIFN